MQIDADGDLYDFPSFTELNRYLDKSQVQVRRRAVDLNDVDIAA